MVRGNAGGPDRGRRARGGDRPHVADHRRPVSLWRGNRRDRYAFGG